MAKFKVYPPTVSEEELNLMLEVVPEGVAVVAMEDGKQTQTLLVFEDTGVVNLWPLAEEFAIRKKLRLDTSDRILVQK